MIASDILVVAIPVAIGFLSSCAVCSENPLHVKGGLAPFKRALCSSWCLCIAWPFLGLVTAHFNSLCAQAIERMWGGGRRTHGREAWGGWGQNSGREQSASLKSARLSPLEHGIARSDYTNKVGGILICVPLYPTPQDHNIHSKTSWGINSQFITSC